MTAKGAKDAKTGPEDFFPPCACFAPFVVNFFLKDGINDPVTGDSLRQTVTWQGRSDVDALAGKRVSLRFTLRRAALFSFAFRK